MEKTMAALHQQWLQTNSSQEKDDLVAWALGTAQPDQPPPPYSTDLIYAQQAMDRAWILMEETAPVRISCNLSNAGPQGHRQCYVEWWPADGSHVLTPCFTTEAESRAFAAFVFAKLLGKV
ncbi:MAG: hypothetical protein G8345_08645 [Magnetococcales bacterium]|nr:hypothetical protein [Magnetococcales bacterium]NGZ26943.1 hypothetical protein [Magnetococcales bacterium]